MYCFVFEQWVEGKLSFNLSHKFFWVARSNKCHRILPQMSYITKKLYLTKKTNSKNNACIFHLARRFPAINNVSRWNATLNMYQSDQVSCAVVIVIGPFFCFMCIDSFHFSSFSFLSQFYRQDTKYDMFLSPKMNNFLHTTNIRMSLFCSG